MPDPAQMAGRPLPAPELETGMVSVRVVRERMGNNVTNHPVTLAGPGQRLDANTDAQGRATFGDVPPGTRVVVQTVVDGETLQSAPFTIPASGGVRIALIAGLEAAAARERLEREQAAQQPARQGIVVFGGESRVILEFQDDNLQVFYLLDIVNNARTPIDIGEPLFIVLPEAASGAGALEGSSTLAVVQGDRIRINGPFPPGVTQVQVGYRLPYSGDTTVVSQQWPAAFEQVFVAAEKVGNLQIASPQFQQQREANAGGAPFLMATGGRINAGGSLTLTLTGLPHRNTHGARCRRRRRGADTGRRVLGGADRTSGAQYAHRGAQATQGQALCRSRRARRGSSPSARRRAALRLASSDARRAAGTSHGRARPWRWRGRRCVNVDFSQVTVSNLSRHFGRRKALSQISFDCHAGEILGLLGPNGAGKSTLLAILATLLVPSSGEVTYGGHRARNAGATLRSRLGMLGHDLFLYPELTARENLSFFARLYGLDDVDTRVAKSLDQARLTDRADDQVTGFSRGMRQRLALERALVHNPRLLLLDEPFTGLDQASTTALVSRLRQLQAQGCLIVLATHDLEVAEPILSRSLFLRSGRLVSDLDASGSLRSRYLRVIAQE